MSDALIERTAQLLAHRACCSEEHNPAQGKLHGYCVVCGVPWPCEYAGKPPSDRQQIERLEAALNPVHGLPPGPWEVWTSCSFRRISCEGDGDVLRGTVHSDGHPDLSWSEQQCQALCDLVNGIRAALEDKQ